MGRLEFIVTNERVSHMRTLKSGSCLLTEKHAPGIYLPILHTKYFENKMLNFYMCVLKSMHIQVFLSLDKNLSAAFAM